MNAPEDRTTSRRGTGGLLAVHAHPDDETLSSGALLSTWAASGAPVTLVTCTRGEQGEVIGPDLAHLEGDGPALAAHRELELAAALDALGVTQHHFLDQLSSDQLRLDQHAEAPSPHRPRFEDSGMAWMPGQTSGTASAPATLGRNAFVAVPLDDAAAGLAAVITRTEPAVVVTYDPAGGYGHPDHVRAHEVTMRAVQMSRVAREAAATAPADRAAADDLAAAPDPVVLWMSTPTSALRASWRVLTDAPWARAHGAAHALSAPDPDGPLPGVASDERPIALEVDVAPVLDRILTAMAAHRTQIHAVHRAPTGAAPTENVLGVYALSNDVLGATPDRETYSLAPSTSPAHWAALTTPTGVWKVA